MLFPGGLVPENDPDRKTFLVALKGHVGDVAGQSGEENVRLHGRFHTHGKTNEEEIRLGCDADMGRPRTLQIEDDSAVLVVLARTQCVQDRLRSRRTRRLPQKKAQAQEDQADGTLGVLHGFLLVFHRLSGQTRRPMNGFPLSRSSTALRKSKACASNIFHCNYNGLRCMQLKADWGLLSL